MMSWNITRKKELVATITHPIAATANGRISLFYGVGKQQFGVTHTALSVRIVPSLFSKPKPAAILSPSAT